MNKNLDSLLESLIKYTQRIVGARGCDLVNSTGTFICKGNSIFAILSNEDDSRLSSVTYLQDGTDTTATGLTFISVSRVDTVTLTGTSGTATVTCDGTGKTATFNSSLTQTATDFVTTNAADYLTGGVVLTSSGADLIFTSSVAGTDFTGNTTIANASGDLAGSVTATTANVTKAINNDKYVPFSFPVYSITVAKGSFWIYYI